MIIVNISNKTVKIFLRFWYPILIGNITIFCKMNIYDAVEIAYLSSFLSFSHWLSLSLTLTLTLSLSHTLSLSVSLSLSDYHISGQSILYWRPEETFLKTDGHTIRHSKILIIATTIINLIIITFNFLYYCYFFYYDNYYFYYDCDYDLERWMNLF